MTKLSIWSAHQSEIVNMRQSGYTLQEIGDHLGVTRERVRQILQENCRNIEIPLLTETRVAEELGCTPWRLSRLRKLGILNPLRRGKYFHYYRMDDLGKIKLLLQNTERGKPDNVWRA